MLSCAEKGIRIAEFIRKRVSIDLFSEFKAHNLIKNTYLNMRANQRCGKAWDQETLNQRLHYKRLEAIYNRRSPSLPNCTKISFTSAMHFSKHGWFYSFLKNSSTSYCGTPHLEKKEKEEQTNQQQSKKFHFRINKKETKNAFAKTPLAVVNDKNGEVPNKNVTRSTKVTVMKAKSLFSPENLTDNRFMITPIVANTPKCTLLNGSNKSTFDRDRYVKSFQKRRENVLSENNHHHYASFQKVSHIQSLSRFES